MKPSRTTRIAWGLIGTLLALVVYVVADNWGSSWFGRASVPHTNIVSKEGHAAQIERGQYLARAGNCIGCHTLLGEGAYFAPELGNVYKRRGPEFIKAWIQAQPTGAPGRRQMPNFHLTEQQLNDLVEFLKYMSEINTANWPPNIEG